MELSAQELWSRVLEAARSSLPDQSFRTWFAGTTAISVTETELLVEAPSEFHVEWLEDKYSALLTELTQRVLGRTLAIALRPAPEGGAHPLPSVEPEPPATATRGDRITGRPHAAPSQGSEGEYRSALNERYTFDRFVVGNNNQLAAAACRAVAEAPARMYNPLFLYGGVGLGKTHLMHAIGLHILAQDASRRVAYVPSEQFTNELVFSIQTGSTAAFRRRYRPIDLLLVDDIHFLEGKERTQEEFFHTFNALYDAQKQIVLTSDRPPKEIPGLEERLVSRFEWGLVADIKPPDYETRIAILRKKGHDDGLLLTDEVIDHIARSCTSSVRELEGAIIKLLAYSSLTQQEISLALARTSLQGGPAGNQGRSELTPERIRDLVASEWRVTPAALSSKRRTKEVIVPRQVAMYLIKDLLDVPLVRIGQLFGGRDHSTVIHSVRKVQGSMDASSTFRDRVDHLKARLSEEL
jgi:chromosomal replication initiator protein